jgi:cysteinyl-tRNA synthetase
VIRLFNTLSRRTEAFEPIEPGRVKMYNCGPTVYSSPHIGNFRSYAFADLLRRTLELAGYEVTQVMNITDVGHLRDELADSGEDRMEAAARAEKVDPQTIARRYTEEFFAGLDLLSIRRAHHHPRASDNVPQMIEIIEGLIRDGFAYVVGQEVYFEVAKFERYGQLSGNVDDELIAGASERVAGDVMARKRDPRDFALWKHDEHHLQQWDSPWGRGFPGWHIECSAMARRYLGDTLDIHTGGVDNIFPHHECEIAQSECFTHRTFVRYWVHAAHLVLEGEKMSKSLGNVVRPQDLIAEGIAPRTLRFYLMSVHYRQPMNFTREELKAKESALERLLNFFDDMRHRASHGQEGAARDALTQRIASAAARYREALFDDLNVSGGLGVLFETVNEINAANPNRAEAAAVVALLRDVDRVLGVLPQDDLTLDAEIEMRIAAREAARKARDFQTSDAIRDELLAKGILLLDTPQGVRWRRT